MNRALTHAFQPGETLVPRQAICLLLAYFLLALAGNGLPCLGPSSAHAESEIAPPQSDAQSEAAAEPEVETPEVVDESAPESESAKNEGDAKKSDTKSDADKQAAEEMQSTDQSSEQTPTEDKSQEEKPQEEKPAPAESKTAEDKPDEKTPAGKAPADDKATDDKANGGKVADDKAPAATGDMNEKNKPAEEPEKKTEEPTKKKPTTEEMERPQEVDPPKSEAKQPAKQEDPPKQETGKKKCIIGATATLLEKQSEMKFRARVDSGAKSCSLHYEKLKIEDASQKENVTERMSENIGKVIHFEVKNSEGKTQVLTSKIAGYVIIKTSDKKEGKRRYKVPLTFRWKNTEKEVLVTLNKRNHMAYPLLLGRNFLRGDFLVDVELDSDD